MLMIRKLRLLLRDNYIFRHTIYPFVRKIANDVLHYRCRILQRYGYEALAKITEVYRKTGVSCYADFGTLLGIIRDGGFIKHDDDMDFTILPPHDNVRVFYRELVSRGFVFERYIVMDGTLKEFSMRYKEISIDFFLQVYSKDGAYMEYIDEKNGDYWTRYKYAKPARLSERRVHGVSAIVPENFDEVLTSEYGMWNQGIKDWNSNMVSTLEKDYGNHELILSRDEQAWNSLIGL